MSEEQAEEQKPHPSEVSPHFFAALVEQATDSIFCLTPYYTIAYANPAFCTFVQRAASPELYGAAINALVTDSPDVLATFDEHIVAHGSWEGILTFRCTDDSTRQGHVMAFVLRDSVGQPTGIGCTVRAVPEAEQHTHSLLNDHARLLQAIIEHIPLAVYVKDLDGTFLLVNRAAAALMHSTPDEIVGQNEAELFPPDIVAIWREHKQHVLAEGRPLTFEEQHPHDDGMHTYLSFRFPVRNAEGTIIAIGGTAIDISERKHAEEALRESQAHLQQLFDANLDAILIADANGHYIDANPAACELLGYERAMLLRMSVDDLQVPESHNTASEQFATYLQSGSVQGEFTFLHPSGELRIVEFSAQQFGPDRHVSVMRDVTARKQAEAALRESEEKYRVLVENADFFIVMYDYNGTMLLLNEHAAQFLGRPADELMGQSLHDIFPAEHAALYLQRVRHVIDTEQPEWREEWSFHPTDRRLFWTGVFPLHHADGSPFAVQVVSHEITALKQAEEALRESEERFRIVSELISDWAFCHMMTPEGRVEFGWITPSFYRLTGYAREDFPTPAEWAHVVHPDDMPILRQRIQNLLAGRIDVSEYRYRAKDGTMRWLRDYGQPEWDTAEQRTVRVFGAAQDITAHKQAEAVLHERVRQFEALRETMNEITAELELAPLLQAILERAIDLLNATAGQVELYDNEQNTLLILAGTDMHPGLVGTYQPLSERGLGVVIRTRRPLVIHDYQQWHEQMPSYARFDVHSLLLVPLLAGERVLGIISVGHKDADRIFDDADIELLTLFAQQATIAIQNAHLFAEMQRLATTDPLTGLHNRRSFFHLAQRAFEQATRYGHPLSIVMLDIDHFKQINDSVGHLMGDQVLQAVAYQCLSVLRAVDIVGRYGGEEIIMALPETAHESAAQVAERLRQHFAHASLPTDRGHITVTVSLGVATCIDTASLTLEHIIDQADQALYQAKQAGRNRVVTWDDNAVMP